MAPLPRFEVVQDEATPSPPPRNPIAEAGIAALKLGLGALAQRALVALSNLFCLLTVGSVFWLFMSIHEPTVYQIVYCTFYAGFVLAVNWIVRAR